MCIDGIRKNGKNIRRIIVVSSKQYTDKAEWFDERLYPFTKEDILEHLCDHNQQCMKQFMSQKECRLGWYYQQLLKLYATYVIPDISPNILILDSDTIFLNPVSFMNDRNGGLYNISDQYHKPYFIHAKKFTNSLVQRVFKNYSGITHHMLMQRPILDHFFKIIESIHEIELWKAFCNCVDIRDFSGTSEYELYFNFVFSQSSEAEIRGLMWKEVKSLKSLAKMKQQGYHYITNHDWRRKK